MSNTRVTAIFPILSAVTLLALFGVSNGSKITQLNVTELVKDGDSYWVNCSYDLQGTGWLNTLTLTKDEQEFLVFENETRLNGVNGIDVEQISNSSEPADCAGQQTCTIQAFVSGATSESSGTYKCALTVRNDNYWDNSSLVGVLSYSNDKTGILSFQTSRVVAESDSYFVNCSFRLAVNDYLHSLNLTKNGSVFYSFNNESHTFSVPGIDRTRIDVLSQGVVRVRNANPESSGTYECVLTWSANGELRNVTKTETLIVQKPLLKLLTTDVVNDTDTYWVNCTYSLSEFDEFVELSVAKDNREFYGLRDGNASSPIKTPVGGISVAQMTTYNDQPGVVRISGASNLSEGFYQCTLLYDNDQQTEPQELEETSESTTSSVSLERSVQYAGSRFSSIDSFAVMPSVFTSGDAILINCSFTIATVNYLSSLSLEKDNRVFYSYSYDGVQLYLTHGLTNLEPVTPGVVRVKESTKDSEGWYTCTLSWLANENVYNDQRNAPLLLESILDDGRNMAAILDASTFIAFVICLFNVALIL